MIFDGRWKWELQKLSWSILVWSKLPTFHDFAKHRLNRAILYSAIILRKLIEDEREAEDIAEKTGWSLPEQVILHTVLSAIKFPYVEKDDWTIRGKFGASNYGAGEIVSLTAREVCNQLIHSYVWSIAHQTDNNGFAGFLVASDTTKKKHLYLISFDEWQNVLTTALKNGAF